MKRVPALQSVILALMACGFMSFMTLSGDNGWRGPYRDGKVTGFEVPSKWPDELHKKWQVAVGLGDASPVLHEGRIYLHTLKDSSEVAMCIEAASGKMIWEAVNNRAPEVTGGAASHPGPRSTPAIAYGKVFNVGAGGYVTCRDARNGTLIWESSEFTAEVPQFFVSCSPLITDNKCIIHLMGKSKGTVVAFQVETGTVAWKLEGEPGTYASPVRMEAFGDMIVIQGEKDLFAVSFSNGNLYWKIPTPSETRFYNSSTPIIDRNRIYIAGQGSGTRALEVRNHNGTFEAAELWKNPGMGVSYNTPVFKDGYLFGNEARFGYLFCMNAATGEIAWADTTKHNRFASMQDLGNVLVSLPATSQLTVFLPDSEKYSSVKTYKVSDTEIYAHPLFAGSNIYTKDKEHLTCWSTTP